jgi:hypothetical protein
MTGTEVLSAAVTEVGRRPHPAADGPSTLRLARSAPHAIVLAVPRPYGRLRRAVGAPGRTDEAVRFLGALVPEPTPTAPDAETPHAPAFTGPATLHEPAEASREVPRTGTPIRLTAEAHLPCPRRASDKDRTPVIDAVRGPARTIRPAEEGR